MTCPLCHPDGALDGAALVVRTPLFRVLRVADPAFPAFYRLVWNAHVREWSDLPSDQRLACTEALCAVEMALRRWVRPDKVNLASLGNQVPHLHWHVIGRFEWDSHFPAPIWGSAVRDPQSTRLQALQDSLLQCDHALQEAFDPGAAAPGADA